MNSIDISASASRPLLLFEAAARHGSFSRAAHEMGVGQPAVSHAIRSLEASLGVKLFRRRHRGVILTEAGEILCERVTAGLLLIRQGLAEARARTTVGKRVTLLVSTSLASYWLMPRIARFKVANPTVDLRCITQDTDRDLALADFDLCIPLGRGQWPGFRCWQLCEEEIFPVCSSAFLDRFGPIESLTQLLHLPQLHLEERYLARCSWRTWLSHYGVPAGGPQQGLTSNDYSIILQWVLDGQGLALGWRHIVQHLLDQGSLIRPIAQRMVTQNPFYIISPERRILTDEADSLREWLVRDAAN